jgi:hypothetical protein
MENKLTTLKSLEDDVLELQALVRDLDSQEKALRNAVIKLDVNRVRPVSKSAKRGFLVPETNR